MPIFKVTIKEEIVRTCVAYVDAVDDVAADKWSGMAPDWVFVPDDSLERYDPSVSSVEQVSAAPENIIVHEVKS